MNGLENTVVVVVSLFAGALVVGLIAHRARIPYTVALLLASLPFSHHAADAFHGEIFYIFLPALIFEAAWNLNRNALALMWKPILLLAIPGVLFTALLIGYGLSWLGLLPLPQGILLGSIIAATDPIAVIATFRRLHVPQDIATLVEGESLFNDGTAVVLYTALVSSFTSQEQITFSGIAIHTLVVMVGGAAIGFFGALVTAFLLRGVDNVMLQIVASIVAAYGTYLTADHFQVSGIFAVLATGASLRAFESFPYGEAATQEVDRFWSVLAFLANSLVFLLMGLRMDFTRMFHEPMLIVATLIGVVVTRLILAYGLLRFVLPPTQRTNRQHIIAIAGMRGALSLALALMLPDSMPHRAVVIDAVFAVVTVTLVVQGLAIAPILRRLSL